MRIILCILALASSLLAQDIIVIRKFPAAASAGNFTLVQSFPSTVGCSGSTTCSMALPASITAGNLLTIQCAAFTNSAVIKSINVGGTLVPVASTMGGNGSSGTLTHSSGYVTSASATAGPVVVTFTANAGSNSTCYGREYSVSSGTPKIDWGHALLKSGTTSVVGETAGTLSGTNDVFQAMMNTDYSLNTGVSGTGWANYKVDSTNGPGWANKLNVVTTGAPTWTGLSGSGNAWVSEMAFATDATACDDEMFIDFNGIASGTTATATNLNAATVGLPTTGSFNGWSVSASPATGFTAQTAATAPNLHTAIRPCGTGVSNTGSGSSVGLQWDMTQTHKTLNFAYLGASTLSSFGFFFQTDLGSTISQDDIAGITSATTGGGIAVAYKNGAIQLECFGGSTSINSVASISTNTWYWITASIDTAAGGSAKVYETSTWTEVGSNSCSAGGWSITLPDVFKLGPVGGDTNTPSNHLWYGNARLRPSGGLIVP